MATLTIRNLDDSLKNRLRVRAALRNRSMEEEARQIIRSALQEAATPAPELSTRIRARFASLGDTRLQIEPREAVRLPESLELQARARPRVAAPATKKTSTRNPR